MEIIVANIHDRQFLLIICTSQSRFLKNLSEEIALVNVGVRPAEVSWNKEAASSQHAAAEQAI